MLTSTNPGLRRFDVVVNSLHSCVSDATKEFSRTPEVSFSKMPSEPRMFFEKTKGCITFKQLKRFADTHCRRELNKEMDMVNSDVKFVNPAFPSISNLPDKELAIHPQSVKLERVFSIFNFPDKMESILSKAVFSGFQIHFSSPETLIRNKVLTISDFSSEGLVSSPSFINNSQELNLTEHGDSSPNLKVRVSSPLM